MYRVLIVDDDLTVRIRLKNLISWELLECEIVGEAAHGLEAIALLDTVQPDIVITDIYMPGMNGVDLIHYIREQASEIYVLALSAYDDFDYVRNSLRYGAFDYLLKHQLTASRLEQILEEATTYLGKRREGKKERKGEIQKEEKEMNLEGKQQIWNDYQKEIADDRYYYARSCIRQTFFPGSEWAYLDILNNKLGKTVLDDPRHTTCTGIGYHSDVVPIETIMTVVARHFALMTEAGFENMTPSCITSFGIYTEILHTWETHPEWEEKTREFLWKATKREFQKPKNLAHTSDVIYKFRNEIAAQKKYSLVDIHTGRPLQVVDHIGCHYAKMFPSKGIGGAEFPAVLSGMVSAWGGQPVDYPERRHCCGFGFRNYLVLANRGFSVANSKKKFESMQPYEPDFIITNCPGCAMFLDKWQYTISEMEGTTYGPDGYGIPVLTYEEVAALVLGYDPWEIGLQMHQVSVEPLLDKMGIRYDPEAKYKNIRGEDMGHPQCPTYLKV